MKVHPNTSSQNRVDQTLRPCDNCTKSSRPYIEGELSFVPQVITTTHERTRSLKLTASLRANRLLFPRSSISMFPFFSHIQYFVNNMSVLFPKKKKFTSTFINFLQSFTIAARRVGGNRTERETEERGRLVHGRGKRK